jgi:hypothetical protein
MLLATLLEFSSKNLCFIRTMVIPGTGGLTFLADWEATCLSIYLSLFDAAGAV